ncbi:MAG: phosphopantothenoylcysteine decarboxylase, partial [Micromonosporaceae bacterium]
AVARGATVTLVAANSALPDPAGVELVRVESTEQMRVAAHRAAEGADVMVMAAAPSDYRPADYSPSKLKKPENGATAPVLRLAVTPDIAAELGRKKSPSQVLVAFAAETAEGAAALQNARAKLATKNADMIVLNVVGKDKVFGADHNSVTVIDAAGAVAELGTASKDDLADAVLDLVVAKLGSVT